MRYAIIALSALWCTFASAQPYTITPSTQQSQAALEELASERGVSVEAALQTLVDQQLEVLAASQKQERFLRVQRKLLQLKKNADINAIEAAIDARRGP